MNKAEVIQKILQGLVRELELYNQSARAAHAEATHEQNKAENKYDTRGLEASYLAHGQAKQAAETEQAIEQFRALEVRPFEQAERIDLGALIELKADAQRGFYLLGPRAGGMEIEHEGQAIVVLTPQSPLGRELMGKQQGAKWEMPMGGRRCRYQIVSIQ